MPLDPTLRRMIATFRRSPEWDAELDLDLVRKMWPVLAGEGIAANTSIVAIQGSRLLVNVPDRTWRIELVRLKKKLLSEVNSLWPVPWIEDIAFTHEDFRN